MDLGWATGDSPPAMVSRPQTLFGRLAHTFVRAARRTKGIFRSAFHAVQKISRLAQFVSSKVRRVISAQTTAFAVSDTTQAFPSDPVPFPQRGEPVLVTEQFTLYAGGYYRQGILCFHDLVSLGFESPCFDVISRADTSQAPPWETFQFTNPTILIEPQTCPISEHQQVFWKAFN